MKRLLNISERNSKRILSIICLVLTLFVPGCLPMEQNLDNLLDTAACQYQAPRDEICVITYRARGGQLNEPILQLLRLGGLSRRPLLLSNPLSPFFMTPPWGESIQCYRTRLCRSSRIADRSIRASLTTCGAATPTSISLRRASHLD